MASCETDDEAWKIVRATISLARELGLSVVAEGVETESVASRLRDAGCQIGQGGGSAGRCRNAHCTMAWASHDGVAGMRAWWRNWTARSLVQALLLGCVLLLIGAASGFRSDRSAPPLSAPQSRRNLALAFEENIIRSIAAMDQVLLVVRNPYARDPGRFARPLGKRTTFINDQTFELSLIDASGMLAQSNSGTRQLVDLSDREHFRVHVGARPDSLFISKPLLGRVSTATPCSSPGGNGLDSESSVWSSSDPSYLARFYQPLQIGGGFVMLVGLDGYVRAGRPVPG